MSTILVSPFSNSGMRDWPKPSFSRLIGLLLDRLGDDMRIKVTGTAGQRLRANEIVRPYPADRVINACGRMTQAELVAEMRGARCIVCNNSGVAHLGGFLGTPTVSIFGGSHQRREWRALGDSVILVTRAIGCSPCQLDHGQVSPYDKACLREIAPETVADAVEAAIARADGEMMRLESA